MQKITFWGKIKKTLVQALIVTMCGVGLFSLPFAIIEIISRRTVRMENLHETFIPLLFMISFIFLLISDDSKMKKLKSDFGISAIYAAVSAILTGLSVAFVVLIFFPGENYENLKPIIWNPAQITGAAVFLIMFIITFLYKRLYFAFCAV